MAWSARAEGDPTWGGRRWGGAEVSGWIPLQGEVGPRPTGRGSPGDWRSAGSVPPIPGLLGDGPLPLQGRGAWEGGETREGLGGVLDLSSSDSRRVSGGLSLFGLA